VDQLTVIKCVDCHQVIDVAKEKYISAIDDELYSVYDSIIATAEGEPHG
jgi:hypothetical protein